MISIIIPLAEDETKWQELVLLLNELPGNCEIILATSDKSNVSLDGFKQLKLIKGPTGRAQQMNAGAKAAKNKWLWFLHADSRFGPEVIKILLKIAKENQETLYYHTLKFLDDGPKAMGWNEWAVRWRSDTLKIPFGDQGFFIRADLFKKLGMYREDLAYGEDHVLTWKARQEGFQIIGTGTSISTSARKYQKGGWLKVTLTHVWFTMKQAAPELFYLWQRQIMRAFR